MAATPGQVGRLAAGAHSGTSGVAAFDTAQDQVKANRDAAVASLQQSAAQAGAPGALTAQLTGSIDAPAGVALNNLASLGAASGAQQQTMAQAVGNYTNEANQALPAITAQDNFDLSQKIGLLNAERAHAGGGGGGGGSLSDSEMRSRLIGLATQYRMGQLQNLSQLEKLDEARSNQPVSYPGVAEVKIPGGYAEQAGISRAPYNPNATPAQVNANPYDAADAAYQKALQNVANEKINVTQAQQNLYGPGLINDAQQIGLAEGGDPGQMYGILTPADAASYAAANEKLGLYHDPNKAATVSVTGQVLDPYKAGAALLSGEKLDKTAVAKSLGQTYIDWTSPSLNKALSTWVIAQNDPKLLAASPQDQRVAFLNDPANASLPKLPLVKTLVDKLTSDAQSGISSQQAGAELQSDPSFSAFPREFELAYTMAQPLFDYYLATHTRSVPVPAGAGG